MKYSIRGNIHTSDGAAIATTINTYELWRLILYEGDVTTFEVWLNTESNKAALFDDLKPFVDLHGGEISWHYCTHDEPEPQPCVIAESYGGTP